MHCDQLFQFQLMVSRLRDNVDDHKLYDETLENASQWLATMSARVAECSDTSGDWHLIEDRIEEIKVGVCLFVLMFLG